MTEQETRSESPGDAVHDMAGLSSSLARGARFIRLSTPVFTLDAPLVLAHPVTLLGDADSPTELRLANPGAGIDITARDCRLEHLVLTGSAGRGRAAIEVRAAPRCTFHHVSITDCEGVGLKATASPDLSFADFCISDAGQDGVVLDGCEGARGELSITRAGLNGLASAVSAAGCLDLDLRISATDIAGTAVTLSATSCAALNARLEIDALRCRRALAILGQRTAPVTAVTARVAAAGITECAVLISNAEHIVLTALAADAVMGPHLRLDGAHGARHCRVTLYDGPDGPASVESRGGSRDNEIISLPTTDGPRPKQRSTVTSIERASIADSCRVCGWTGLFRRTSRLTRETFLCPSCRASLRYRAQAAALIEIIAAGKASSLTELADAGGLAHLSVFEPGLVGPLRRHLAKAGIYRKSYFGEGAARIAEEEGASQQDLMALTYPDEHFDLVVTSDVFEHVRRPFAAFAEVRRILKPGGHHVFSIPVTEPVPAKSVLRVDTSGADDILLLPAVYHGAGADGGRSLVYTDFGADLIEHLAELDFPTRIIRYTGDGADGPVALTFVSTRSALR